jgi:formylmethanofuran dehydrogenase subunit C
MSDVVTLSRRGAADGPLDVEGVTADKIAGLAQREIASLPVRVGSRAAKLGDFFDVHGERAGRVCIDGDVSQVHGIGAGMTGGEIIVRGSAGADVAARARRGLVVVAGDVGSDAARAMIAGTLVVYGRTGSRPGWGSKRGSIVALGGIDVPETYWLACRYQANYLRLLLTYLRRSYGLTIDDRTLSGQYRRYCGAAGTPGHGEILEWVETRAIAG